MAGIPHYYTLREKWNNDEAFLQAARTIRTHGVVRRFYTRKQRYLDVNGSQYWTMDAKVRETTLINRQYCWHGAYWSQYDAAAQSYDSPWGGEWAAQKEREAHYELAQPRGRVLDMGCGTGLFVDYRYRNIDRENYVGIDPSFGMLAKFRLKHPDYAKHATLLRTSFEDYETTLRFDTIVALFGAASYVTGTDVVAKTSHLLAPRGKALLTFYPPATTSARGSERSRNWPPPPTRQRHKATSTSSSSPPRTTSASFRPLGISRRAVGGLRRPALPRHGSNHCGYTHRRMKNADSLLAHLSPRFTDRTEDIAVEALGYILSTSEAARAGLLDILREGGASVVLSRIDTQVAGVGGERPDLVGWDDNGDECLLVEAKFWASLTDNQPNGYLKRLGCGGVLLFVAPEVRLDALWPELERRAKEGDLKWTADAERARSADVCGKRLILTAWRTLLKAAKRSAGKAKDTAAVANIQQLDGLCEREDEAAFVPLKREELGPEVPRRLVHLNRIVDRVVGKAEEEGLVSTEGCGERKARDGYGHWLELRVRKGGSRANGRPAGACLCLHYAAWSRCRETPIWLELADEAKDWPVLPLKEVKKRLQDQVVVGPDKTDLIPIYLPTGVELDQVVDSVVARLRELAHRIAGA